MKAQRYTFKAFFGFYTEGPIFEYTTNFRLTTHCFFSTKKKVCQEKTYRTEVVFEDKN